MSSIGPDGWASHSRGNLLHDRGKIEEKMVRTSSIYYKLPRLGMKPISTHSNRFKRKSSDDSPCAVVPENVEESPMQLLLSLGPEPLPPLSP